MRQNVVFICETDHNNSVYKLISATFALRELKVFNKRFSQSTLRSAGLVESGKSHLQVSIKLSVKSKGKFGDKYMVKLVQN